MSPKTSPHSLSRLLARSALALVVVVGLFIAWSGTRIVKAWLDAERIEFDTSQASMDIEALEQAARERIAEEIRDAEAAEQADPDYGGAVGDSQQATEDELDNLEQVGEAEVQVESEALQTYLIIGTDQRPDWGASRADVILMFILPPDNDPILLSLPRDLWIGNPCTGGVSRINATLLGCGGQATGPELLSLAVEEYTGIPIDRFALFTFEGFVEIVDTVGGVEICVDQASRTDWRSGGVYVFEEGCQEVDGEAALAWMRSRHTEVLTESGAWVTMPGVSDLTRNQRQQDLIIQALEKLKGFRNITAFASLVETLAHTFAIDDDLGLIEAIYLAWDQRDLDPASIQRPVIPTRFYVTDSGAEVLLPTEPFQDVLAEIWPGIRAEMAEPTSAAGE